MDPRDWYEADLQPYDGSDPEKPTLGLQKPTVRETGIGLHRCVSML